MNAYKLVKDIPGLKAGTIFLHDKNDNIKGSIGCGCLKNAWVNGNCQGGWCAETHVFPGQLIDDPEWFKSIKNKKNQKLELSNYDRYIKASKAVDISNLVNMMENVIKEFKRFTISNET